MTSHTLRIEGDTGRCIIVLCLCVLLHQNKLWISHLISCLI